MTVLSKGIECPPIYGDPALLMPYITDYKRKEPKYKYGLIPHYADENEIQVENLKNNGVKIINTGERESKDSLKNFIITKINDQEIETADEAVKILENVASNSLEKLQSILREKINNPNLILKKINLLFPQFLL